MIGVLVFVIIGLLIFIFFLQRRSGNCNINCSWTDNKLNWEDSMTVNLNTVWSPIVFLTMSCEQRHLLCILLVFFRRWGREVKGHPIISIFHCRFYLVSRDVSHVLVELVSFTHALYLKAATKLSRGRTIIRNQDRPLIIWMSVEN